MEILDFFGLFFVGYGVCGFVYDIISLIKNYLG
jgi:hypothetical protein